MFFKKSEKIDSDAVSTAYFVTFAFWGIVLLVNSFFEIFEREFISSSWIILVLGLAVFFITNFVSTKTRKSQANK